MSDIRERLRVSLREQVCVHAGCPVKSVWAMGDGWSRLFLGTENAKVSPCCWTMHFPSRGAGEGPHLVRCSVHQP